MKYYRFAFGMMLALVAPSAHAQNTDPRAVDGVQFFVAFCVAPSGKPDRALAVIGNGNDLARRLPDDVVRQAQGGREGGVGWAVRSPNDAQLMLDYEARGICGLRIREADESSVSEVFDKTIRDAANRGGFELTSKAPEVRQVDGARTTYRAYSLTMGDRTAHLALTTADRTVGGQQHFMTFGFVQ